MQQRAIAGTAVSAIGLGGMPMSVEGRPDRERSVATIHAALDAGVTLIDTADAYHLDATDPGHNETLVAEALATYGGDVSHVLVPGSSRPETARDSAAAVDLELDADELASLSRA